MSKKNELTVQQMVQALLVYLCQEDLATLIGVSQAALSRIKRGETDSVDYRVVDAIRKLHKRYRSGINKLANAG